LVFMPKKKRLEYERELRLELMGQVKKACDENGLTLPPVAKGCGG